MLRGAAQVRGGGQELEGDEILPVPVNQVVQAEQSPVAEALSVGGFGEREEAVIGDW